MSSRNMCLLPRATLHSDSEQFIYNSQPARINENTTKNKWKLLIFDWKIA
jgi:hypothetical protein